MDSSVMKQIAALRRMTVGELREKWRDLYGEESRSRNKDFMFRRLAWRVQELEYGGLSDRAKERLAELAPDSFVRARTPAEMIPAAEPDPAPRAKRDPRLPVPGTVLVRRYRDRDLRLVVHDDHFELDGQSFQSLSEAARYVTGSRWNGRLFWGLVPRKRRS